MLTKEQLEFRRTGIGGSDAAAVIGLSKFNSPIDVYLSKIQEVKEICNSSMERGNILEPFIKRLFEIKTGFFSEKKDSIRSDDHSFMIANLDGFCKAERAVIEFKSANYLTKSEWGKEGTDEMPKDYLIQLAHYASVMKVKKAYLGVLFGNETTFDLYCFIQNQINQGLDIDISELKCDFKIYVYNEEPILQKKLINKEEYFWFEYVQKGVLPNLDSYTCEDLLKIFPVATKQEKIISSDGLIELKNLNQIKLLKKELNKKEEISKSNLMKLFGEASILTDDKGSKLATWENQTRSLIDKDALEKNYPHIYQQFLQQNTTRVLNLIKEKNHD